MLKTQTSSSNEDDSGNIIDISRFVSNTNPKNDNLFYSDKNINNESIQNELFEKKFSFVKGEKIVIPASLFKHEKDLISSFDNLHDDIYLSHPYRKRRIAWFIYDIEKSLLSYQKGKIDFSQEINVAGENVNPVSGGIYRKFSPVENPENPFLEALIKFQISKFLNNSSLIGNSKFFQIDVHQYRVIANKDHYGNATPEGIHLDNQAFQSLTLIKKRNAAGGVNNFFNEHKRHVASIELVNRYDSIYFLYCYHDVSPIFPIDQEKEGIRDILIIGIDPLDINIFDI